jgi:energy-coupling factor transporter ATP-binding protein EcfA2
MLSEETKRRIEHLLAVQDTYRPGEEARTALADKTLIMLVGPTGAGKSTVMQGLIRLDSDISIVGTITTRPPRPDDQFDRYTFFEHTDEGLQPLLKDIAERKLIQYAVNPYSYQIYGSAPGDYPSRINIGDYFSSVVDDFHAYGFGRIIPITLVTAPESWQKRFDERFPTGDPQRESRRREAVESLEWSLGAHHTTHYFVFNPEGSPQAAASDIRAVVHGNAPAQAPIRTIAEACLETIQRDRL